MESKQRQILSNLVKFNGASIASITTETTVDLLGGKKNHMKGKVTKVSVDSNVMIFTNTNSNGYNNMVKKRLQKEGKNPDTFVLSPRKWGERMPETPFVLHKGNYYLEVIFLKKPVNTYYMYEGKRIEKTDIQGLKPAKESVDSQGGLTDKVQIRTYKLESIISIKMGALSVNA